MVVVVVVAAAVVVMMVVVAAAVMMAVVGLVGWICPVWTRKLVEEGNRIHRDRTSTDDNRRMVAEDGTHRTMGILLPARGEEEEEDRKKVDSEVVEDSEDDDIPHKEGVRIHPCHRPRSVALHETADRHHPVVMILVLIEHHLLL